MTLTEIVMSEKEQQYFDLMFNQNMGVDESLKILREKGVAATRTELVKFRQGALEAAIEQQREEHMSELILTSFDRTKLEFDDLVKTTKSILRNSDESADKLAAIRELRALLETALSQQNKVAEQLINAMNEKRKEDKEKLQLHELLKQEKERWFEQMDVTITEDNKVILNKPTPSFIDDFKRWKFQKEMREGTVSVNG